MTEAKGNRALAGDLLGISHYSLSRRIEKNSQLFAIWGQSSSVDGPRPPSEADVLSRSAPVLPDSLPTSIELIDMVSAADKLHHENALKKLGLSPKLLERIRNFSDLATSTGQFFAISLETTQRSYYVQSLELMGVASELRDRLLAKVGEAGHIADDEVRALLNRNYVEMVKEAGRAYELMLTGTQAMVEMMLKTRSIDKPDGRMRKPKWGRIQNVKSDAKT